MEQQKFRISLDPQSLVPALSVRKYYLLSMGLTILMGALIALLYNKLPRVVPLLMTEPWGEARLAPKIYLTLLPLLSLGVAGVNLLVSRAVESQLKALVTSLAVGTMVVSIMLFVAFYGIVQSLL